MITARTAARHVKMSVSGGTTKEGRRFTPIFRSLTFFVAFGVVLVELCVTVYVRVASPLAKPASTQSQ